MQRILVLILLELNLFAFYNPFFKDDIQRKEIHKEVIKKSIYKPVVARKSIDMGYFGFVSSAIGEFALVSFNGKNIVISQNDSLYNNEEVFKIKKITSNYILLKDRYGRVQTVYFSSEENK